MLGPQDLLFLCCTVDVTLLDLEHAYCPEVRYVLCSELDVERGGLPPIIQDRKFHTLHVVN